MQSNTLTVEGNNLLGSHDDINSDDLAQWVWQEKIKMLFVNHKHSWFLSLVTAAVIATFSIESQDILTGVMWFLFFALITLIRASITESFFKSSIKPEDYNVWYKKFFWASMAAGFGWGIGGLIIGESLQPVSQVIILLILIGVCAVAVPLLGIVRNVMIAFQLPAIIPYLLFIAVSLENKGIIVFSVFFLYMSGVIIAMRRIEESMETSLINQFKMKQMAGSLEESNKELLDENEKLEHLTLVDSLTQLYNRRYFEKQLEKEWKRSVRNNGSLTLMVIDIDYFKHYNDTYGHAKGDNCLVEIARILKGALQRPGDIVARIGGEEFVALLPNIGEEGAPTVAKTMQTKLKEAEIAHESSPVSGYLTVSIGIASTTPVHETTALGLFKAADKALYKAKSAGRNQIIVGEIDVFDN